MSDLDETSYINSFLDGICHVFNFFYRFLIVGNQLSVSNDRSSIIGYLLSAMNYRLSIIGQQENRLSSRKIIQSDLNENFSNQDAIY